MAYQLQKNDVILLLGAGASVEAAIPATEGMIKDIVGLLDKKWKRFKGLYEFITQQNKALEKETSIEDLVGILYELEELLKKEHPLSGLNLSFIDFFTRAIGGHELIVDFRTQITAQLRSWIDLPKTTLAKHYRHIALFQKEYQRSLRVFTLNYDRCIEEACKSFKYEDGRINCLIERGFGDEEEEENQIWSWERFKVDEKEDSMIAPVPPPDIFLYKMHGSIDWTRDDTQRLIYTKALARNENFEIIFGTRQKVRAYDPFLFFIYEFREYSRDAKLIVICGYNFGDDHINRILKQGLESKPKQKLIVNRFGENEEVGKEFVKNKLGLKNDNQIVIVCGPASNFFKDTLQLQYLNSLIDEPKDLPF